jgi:hypothetical protein
MIVNKYDPIDSAWSYRFFHHKRKIKNDSSEAIEKKFLSSFFLKVSNNNPLHIFEGSKFMLLNFCDWLWAWRLRNTLKSTCFCNFVPSLHRHPF